MILTTAQAIETLMKIEYSSDGFVNRAPDEQDFLSAMACLRDATGYVEPNRIPIMSKARVRRGQIYTAQATGMFAEIGKDSIRITGTYYGKAVDVTFKVGDTAEYDSYNLRYLGEIVKITDKAVTIRPQYSKGKVKRLDLYSFAWRNHNFNLQKALDENAETSQYI